MDREHELEPEKDLAFDMAKRALPLAPFIILVAGLLQGSDGVWTAMLAIGVVVANLLLSAFMLSWAARISPTALMGAALAGFIVRMLLVTGVVLAVRHQPWIDLPTLAVTILGTHLALLVWEMRYVSASLAYPSLKPKEAPGS
jgi:hypothetical protein